MFSKLHKAIFLFLLLSVTLLPKARAQVKPTPATERMKGLEQRKILSQRSTYNSTAFRNIGPTVMSGRVVDLEVNASDPTEFYVAYATGGLWYSNNNGQSFTPLFDSLDVMTIGDIAVNWNTGDIWVGTGEVNSSRSTYAGLGVYKSSDKGKTWNYLGLPESHHIGKIQLHPTNPNTAWVAVMGHLYSANKERGVYQTTDGGKTWKHTLAIDENTGVVELELNPQNPSELYAAAWYRTRRAWNFEEGGATSGIYKSGDGGATWTLITKGGSGFPSGSHVGRIGLAVYPKNPQIVYAIVDNQQARPDTAKKDTAKYVLNDFKNLNVAQFAALNTAKVDTFLKQMGLLSRYNAAQIKEGVASGRWKPTVLSDHFNVNDGFQGTPIGAEIYRSDNGGQSWKKANTKALNLYSTFGYYFGKIYVSPANDQKLVITGIDIEYSTDGGKTFTEMADDNVHADHHAVWINPARDSHIFSGNDGGLNISYDDGKNWFKANTPPLGQLYTVTVDNARPYNVYGGLQDNGVWWGPSTYRFGTAWHQNGNYPYKSIGGGDGMQVQVDTTDNQTVYAGSQFGAYTRINKMDPRSRKSVRPLHSLGEAPLRFNWQAPILLSKHNPQVFYIGANRLYRSFNRGDSLAPLGPDLTGGKVEGDVPYGTLTAIAESPLRFGLLYTGSDDGRIQVSKDAGFSWTGVGNALAGKKAAAAQLPQGLWVSRLVASRFSEPRVYASLNGYRNDDFRPFLYVSEDHGATWQQLGTDLPAEPINVVREDPWNENILYVGTDGGLYVSTDRGKTFMMWGAGLPKSIPVHDIAIQEREREIVLGTHGRSLYVAKLPGAQKEKQ
jgi:hypothetical protein